MDLTHPERLWWLAALPLLWILARPLRPKAIVATPYLALWKRAQERLRRRPLRVRWLRLVLLALAFATALLAFAGARSGHRSGPTQLSILLDTSASMAARQGPAQATALDQAKAKIRERLTRLPAELVVTLTAVGGTSAPVSRSLGRDPGWLATLMPGTGPGAVGLAALASRVATPECLVWTLTDGLLPTDVPKIGALSLVGAPGGNLAITRVAIADAWPLPEIRVQVEVQNASAGSRVATLAVSGGAVATNSDLQLAEGASVTATLELRRTIGGSVKIALVPSTDLLADDDAIEIVIPAPAATALAVLSDQDEDPMLRAAARALAAECGGRVVPAGSTDGVGLLLIDGGSLPTSGLGPKMITFGTRFSKAPLDAAALLTRPTLVDWDRASPLLQGLDLSELTITRALAAEFGGAGSVLANGADGPLVVVSEWPEGRSVHFAFSLTESNLALLPAFPSLLRRAFAACHREKAEARVVPGALLDATESDLRRRAPGAIERDLPEFGSPGSSLVVPFLLAALTLLVARIYS